LGAFGGVVGALDVEGLAVAAEGEGLRAVGGVEAAEGAAGFAVVAVRGKAEALGVGEGTVEERRRDGGVRVRFRGGAR
jgi:hypothetical protein